MRGLVALGAAMVIGAFALAALDRLGDGRAYSAAEDYLRASARVRQIMGGSFEVERTGGSVMASEVANWRGRLTSSVKSADAHVGLVRVGDEWIVTLVRVRPAGEGWQDVVRRQAPDR